MPTYDYRCQKCEGTFEVTRSMGSTEDVQCPECHVEAKRVFTPVGVSFKGSGFHNTDYRPKPAESEGGCASKSEESPKCATCPAAT